MENQKQLKEMYKCINAISTDGARYLDCDGVTDVEYLKDSIESLEYHVEKLNEAIERIQNRLEEIEQ